MNQPEVLLFDLGGVLVENTMFDDLRRLLPDTFDDLHISWLSSKAVQRFERGEADADTFASEFIAEWGLPLSADTFIEQFSGWPKGLYPGARELLISLRKSHKVAYLSNSNATHWSRFPDILALADAAFASHLCGLVKPDAAIFEHVVSELRCEPSRVWFFDDSARNVEAAEVAGLRAFHTVGFDELETTLRSLGLTGTRAA